MPKCIIKNLLRNIIYLLFLGILVYSCTLVTEPDPIYNRNASPPQVYSFNFTDFTPGQHVDGTVRMTFNSPDVNSPDAVARLIVDSSDTYYYSSLPFTVELDTRNYSEGIHKIAFYVYLNDKTLGLLNIINAPNKIYETTLYFDRTPPDIVQLTVAMGNGNNINLNWTKSVAENFYSYLVFKSVDGNTFLPVDTIADKNSTSYIDTAGTGLIGIKYQYKVAVTTDIKLKYQADSNTGELIRGAPYLYNFTKLVGGPFLNETLDRVYFMTESKLVSFDASGNTLSADLDLTGFMSIDGVKLFAFNYDKSKIYLFNTAGNILWVLNSSNLSVIKKAALPESGWQLYVLDDSRILFNAYYKMSIVDIDSNQVLNSIEFSNQSMASCAVLNQNNSRLIISYNNNGSWYLEVMDVTNNNFTITQSLKTYGGQYLSMKIGGDRLYCDGKLVYNANTLTGIMTINTDEYIKSFAVSQNNAALLQDAIFSVPGLYNINCNKISIYDNAIQKISEFYLHCGYTMQMSSYKMFLSPDYSTRPVTNVIGYSFKYGE
jgi:hypothetical protein